MLARNDFLQGRYRIVRRLGHGGMGAVYEAIDEKFGEPIALKEIIVENLVGERQKEMFVKAFEREAKALAKARHEAVPYVRDYFPEQGRQFLVMELIEGPDLAEMLEKQQRPFPLADALNWMYQLLDALDYLHTLQHPIIHRDIKPQNLKLNFRRKIKLLDFGIAKSVDAASTFTNQTFVGATLNYSPIEQILPAITPTFREFIILKHAQKARYVLSQNTDARCDLYAVGATFYHLLTNQFPVDSAKRTLEIWEGNADPLINPTALNPEIPSSVSAFLQKALEVERDNRFSSAAEMQQALRAVAAELKNWRKKTEHTLQMSEQERLRILAEERKLRERTPTQAKTERLITGDEIGAETIRDIPREILLPQPIPKPSSDTFASANFPITDSSLNQAPETQPTGSISQSELTGVYYLSGLLDSKNVQPPAPMPEPTPAAMPEPVKTTSTVRRQYPSLLWIIPIIVFGLFMIGGVVGIVWLFSSDSTSRNTKKKDDIRNSTSIIAPAETPTPAPSVSPTPSPIQTPTTAQTPAQNSPVERNERTKPVVTATPDRTPEQETTKTPTAKQTPPKTPPKRNTQKPPAKQTDPSCIYNNSCK
jgi:serine/threonine protein kinase